VNRSHTLSLLYGLGAAFVAALIGPFYAMIPLILATPIVFLTFGRAVTGSPIQPDFERLLGAFGLAWLLLLPVAPAVQRAVEVGSANVWTWSLALGFAPLLVALASTVRRRRQALT
jgi:hypothetical protein